MTPGITPGLPMERYLAVEAVSSGIIQDMIERCPRAAWFGSWLNPNPVREDKEIMDKGTVAHAILLEGSSACCAVIDPEDYPGKTGGVPIGWTNNAIREARDIARLQGKIPILIGDMVEIDAMVAEAKRFIDSLKHTEPAIWKTFQPDGGESELTMTFDWDGTPCKMRPDRISTDRMVLANYKTTGTSVEPNRWGRAQLLGAGYDLGGAFYCEGIYRLTGKHPAHVWIAQETAPPYLCSLVGLDPAGWESAHAEVSAGVRKWRQCVESNSWPSYPSRVCYVEAPQYLTAQREERQLDGIWEYNGTPLAEQA